MAATKEKSTEVKAPAVARQSAVVSSIDVGSALSEDRFAAPDTRRTQWDQKLDEVYNLTADGSIPRNDDETLKFVKIGAYKNTQGAKAQIKAFIKQGKDTTYEFRANGSDLYVRVREV